MAKITNADALLIGIKMVARRAKAAHGQANCNEKSSAKLEKLGQLLSNESFGEAFVTTQSASDAMELFSKNGLSLTLVEVNGIAHRVKSAAMRLIESDGEIPDEDMDLVAGGSYSFITGFDDIAGMFSPDEEVPLSSKWCFL